MVNIKIHEVGLRDGLQIEKEVVPYEKKLDWSIKLINSKVDILQLGSFVNPAKVPQMADTDKLFEHFKINKPQGVLLSGLVLNDKGLDRGLNSGVDLFCMGVSASETHSKKNTGMTIDEALKAITIMAKKALSNNKKVQASVQSAFGCGFEGEVKKDKVISIAKELLNSGVKIISLADTAGHANPTQVEDLFKEIKKIAPDVELACHIHDTYGFGLANTYAAYRAGVTYFETAFGGLGGCPFTAVTGGNVPTEDLLHMFNRMGLKEDINLDEIVNVSKNAAEFFKRELPAKILKTGPIKGSN